MSGILLTLAYDGGDYCGWQRQKNGVSVQEKLEEGLQRLYKREITVTGASRTDAGVHALGQRALYKADQPAIPFKQLPPAINACLPEDIVVNAAEEVGDAFCPIRDAKAKTYEYKIYSGGFLNPLVRNYSCFVKSSLNVADMALAAGYFVGEKDFAAFCAAGGNAKTTVRTVFSSEIQFDGHAITFVVRGNGFLYNMVRIMAGTLIYVGQGKIKPGEIPGILSGLDRTKAGITVPPQGLTLVSVEY